MGQWRPTIGDPSFVGWFTVGSYFGCATVASILTFVNLKADRRPFFFWVVICIMMVLLGINKQLDLQTLFGEVGRQIAKAQGWYDHRRVVQFWFIVAFAAVMLGIFLWLVVIMRDLFGRFTLAFTGIFLLISFIVIRAASFHHVDEVLRIELFGTRFHRLLELAGIFLIAVAGLKEIIRVRQTNGK